MRNELDSAFVRRSAQRLLLVAFALHDDADAIRMSNVFVDMLLDATSSITLDLLSTLVLDESTRMLNDDECERLVTNAITRDTIAQTYSRLIAHCIRYVHSI